MKQYIALCNRIFNEGAWVINERTGQRCLTVINADMEYDCSEGHIPMLTTKKTYWRSAIAEMLGYLRGYDNAEQFKAIGCNTWNANANDNKHWLDNPNRKGKGDMGRVYGVQGRRWKNSQLNTTDQLKVIYEKLRKGIDDRRLIMTFWNPGELEMGCLPACMHTHTFSLLGDTLHLTSYQRSVDVPIGLPFNMIQTAWLLRIMAQITGYKAGKVFHKMVNVHVYENQLELLKEQVMREPYVLPKLVINPGIDNLEDLEHSMVVGADNGISNYQHHPIIKYPFSV